MLVSIIYRSHHSQLCYYY